MMNLLWLWKFDKMLNYSWKMVALYDKMATNNTF